VRATHALNALENGEWEITLENVRDDIGNFVPEDDSKWKIDLR